MNEQTAISIDRRLSVVILLLAYQMTEGKTLAEGAPLLNRLGLSNAEIADVFDSPANVVRARLTEKKKKKTTGRQ
jgi:hypothetical protein